ncbi:hypothetical protein BDK51DRAFT_52714, partial [Blyttiomyces helicus]
MKSNRWIMWRLPVDGEIPPPRSNPGPRSTNHRAPPRAPLFVNRDPAVHMDVQDQKRRLAAGHRHVQLQTIRAIRDHLARLPPLGPHSPPEQKALYAILTDALLAEPPAPLPAALAADAIVSLVRAGSLPWLTGLNDLSNALPSVPPPHLPHLVRGIADLLVLHVTSWKGPQDTYTCPFGMRTPRPHPLVVVAATRRDAWPALAAQLPRIVANTQTHGSVALKMLAPFVRFATLDPLHAAPAQPGAQLLAAAVLQWFLRAVQDPTAFGPGLCAQAFDILFSAVEALPPVPSDPGLMQGMLLEALVTLAVDAPDQRVKLRLLVLLLSFACEGRRLMRPLATTLLLLRSFVDRGTIDFSDPAASSAAVVAVAWLLMDVPDPEELDLLVHVLVSVVGNVDTSSPALRVTLCIAVCPLLQVVSEAQTEAAKKCAFQILMDLEKAVLRKPVGEINNLDKLLATYRALPSTGPLSILLVHLSQLLDFHSSPTDLPTAFTSTLPHVTALFTLSLLSHPSLSTRLAALSALPAIPTQPPLTLLAPLLHTLRSDPVPELQHAVLLSALPALTSAHDAFVTARVLRVATSLAGDADVGTLAAVAVRALVEIWRRQPRVWPQVRGRLVAWAKRRRFGRPIRALQHAVWADELELEISFMASLRDIAALKAAEHGQELLPLIFSLLQAQDLHPSSTCFALEALARCIDADITDPRAGRALASFGHVSIWNVFMRQYVAANAASASPEIVVKICEYYRLVAVKADESEVFMTFKPEILANLYPLATHATPSIRAAAYAALAAFPPPDLFPLLPPPRDLLSSIFVPAADPPMSIATLLASLVKHECHHMGRALFKGLAVAPGARPDVAPDADEVEVVRRTAREIAGEVRAAWESGKGAGGRSGLGDDFFQDLPLLIHINVLFADPPAAAAIFAPPPPPPTPHPTPPPLFQTLPLHRSLSTALRDLTLSDSPALRLDALPAWTAFWESGLLDLPETVVSDAAADLRRRLAEARTSAAIANVVLAIGGLITAASSLGLAPASEHATHAVDTLLATHSVPSGGPTTDAHSSDEVQFAVACAIAGLARVLHPSDERRLGGIKEALRKGAEREMGDGENWQQLASAYGLSLLLASDLATSSPPSPPLLFASLTSYILSGLTPAARLGAAIGLTTLLRGPLREVGDGWTADIIPVIAWAVARLRAGPVDGDDIDAVTGMWVASAGVVGGWIVGDEAEEVEQLLRGAVEMSVSKRELQTIHTNALLGYMRVLHVRAPLDTLTSQAASLLATARGTTSSPSRITALLALGSLLGLDHPTPDPPPPPPPAPAAYPALDPLRILATIPQDLRVARTAGWILGKLFRALRDPPQTADVHRPRTRDPPDYRRLNVGASYLRAAFDAVAHAPDSATPHSLNIVVAALVDAAPLPPVDWAAPIARLDALAPPPDDNPLDGPAARLAAGLDGRSAVDAFIAKVEAAMRGGGIECAREVAGEAGVGRVLALGGFGEEKVGTGPALAPSKLAFAKTAESYLAPLPPPTASPALIELRLDLVQTLARAYHALPQTPSTIPANESIRTLATILTTVNITLAPLLATLTSPSVPRTPKSLLALARLSEIGAAPPLALAPALRQSLASAPAARAAALSVLKLPAVPWIVHALDAAIVACAAARAEEVERACAVLVPGVVAMPALGGVGAGWEAVEVEAAMLMPELLREDA